MKFGNTIYKTSTYVILLALLFGSTEGIRVDPVPTATPGAINSTIANSSTNTTALIGTQVSAYPNPAEAPTKSDQFGKFNNITQKISSALKEVFPKDSLTLHEFINYVKAVVPKLTEGEIQEIFNFVDINGNDKVTLNEWGSFVTLFVLPFEACDSDGSKVLNEEEFKTCFDNDPRTRSLKFRKRYETSKYGIIMDTISTRGTREINFADYLFVRKALHGWEKCRSTDTYIAKDNFSCALNTAVSNKYTLKLDIERIYNVGMDISADRNLIQLDFIAYLRVLHFTYIFSVFNAPYDTPYLEKTQWRKAIKEDRLPNNFEESEIDYIYDLINTNSQKPVTTIDFASWCFFFNLHKLVNQYSSSKPLQISREDFVKMLDDPYVSKEIVLAIDGSATNFSEPEYQEASLTLNKQRLNESKFYKFKQDASVKTALTQDDKNIKAEYYEIKPNKENREIFFTTIADNDKNYILKKNLFKAFQLANLYVNLLGKCTKTRPIPLTKFISELPTLYETVFPPINILQRKTLRYYNTLPGEIYLDLLTFIALESFEHKIETYTMLKISLNETVLKTILQDFGMTNMPDTVIDTALEGRDALGRRQFKPDEIIKNCILVQAVTSVKRRELETIAINGLKENKNPERLYPMSPARQLITNKV
jgi:hypothetical protein